MRHAAALNGARAWMFVSTHEPDLFTEFVEWQSESDNFPIVEELQQALGILNTAFDSERSDTWIEARM